ncbi:MAG: protein kinase [Myxococcales bacterium]|nr:protein kinase [Myxococcales bacterium]
MPSHAGLPAVRGAWVAAGQGFVATEFPHGKLLSELSCPLEPAAVAAVGAELAGALSALHREGVVHGALSADSVLLAESGSAWLWDVPVVLANRLADRRKLPPQLAEIAHFLAPEVARGEDPTPRSDVYALAALLCAAAGAEPPRARSALELLYWVAGGAWRPAVPPSFPPPLRDLMERVLSPDPERRPSAGEAALLLAGAASHHSVLDSTASEGLLDGETLLRALCSHAEIDRASPAPDHAVEPAVPGPARQPAVPLSSLGSSRDHPSPFTPSGGRACAVRSRRASAPPGLTQARPSSSPARAQPLPRASGQVEQDPFDAVVARQQEGRPSEPEGEPTLSWRKP